MLGQRAGGAAHSVRKPERAMIELVDAMKDLIEQMRTVVMRSHAVAQKNEDCRVLADL